MTSGGGRALQPRVRPLGVSLPITDMVYSILYEDRPAADAVAALLSRPMRHELG